MGLSFNIKAICTLSGFLKLIEILLAIICIALLRHYSLDFGSSSGSGGWNDAGSFRDRYLVGVIAIGSAILIAFPLLVGYVFFETSSNLLETLFCFTAALMNITGGSLAIENYHDRDHGNETVQAGLGMGALMILNTLAFLIDAITGTIHSK